MKNNNIFHYAYIILHLIHDLDTLRNRPKQRKHMHNEQRFNELKLQTKQYTVELQMAGDKL